MYRLRAAGNAYIVSPAEAVAQATLMSYDVQAVMRQGAHKQQWC